MLEIKTTKQYRDIPDNDFILLLRRPHSKDKLHKPTCDSFKIHDKLLKNEGIEIDPDSIKNTKFERNATYYHIPSNDKETLIKYSDKKCGLCLKNYNF